MIFNFLRRALKSQASRISLLFLLYFLIFLACAQLHHEKTFQMRKIKIKVENRNGKKNPKYRQTLEEKLDIFSSLGIVWMWLLFQNINSTVLQRTLILHHESYHSKFQLNNLFFDNYCIANNLLLIIDIIFIIGHQYWIMTYFLT